MREREREREREGGGEGGREGEGEGGRGGLGLRACLEKALFSLQNTKHKTQHEYAKKNEPCGSKLALAKKLEILKKISKLAFSRKTKYFPQCF